MGKHNIFYFIKEGACNLFKHGFMSFAAIGITVACLLIMGTFTLVAVNANEMLKDMEAQNQMLAFVDESYSIDEAKALEAALLAISNVERVTFISNSEAAEAFRNRYEGDELFQSLPDDNFRHRYAIDLKDIGYMRETHNALLAVEGIADVNAYEEEAAGFITIRNVAGIVSVTLITVLFIVSVFIIANTIKLTTFDRRDEIAIMKMVGATNSFIRWPFV
jgi:cell division transport system permease protein